MIVLVRDDNAVRVPKEIVLQLSESEIATLFEALAYAPFSVSRSAIWQQLYGALTANQIETKYTERSYGA